MTTMAAVATWDRLLNRYPPAVLVLADGTVFKGYSIGVEGQTVGELVFNTAMTGYQEILTDPSYCQQIVTFTYPHIGNVGVNSEDIESNSVQVAGMVIRDVSPIVSNWRAQDSLGAYLKKANIVGIAGIDTRKLTRLLRDRGAQGACIKTGYGDETIAAAMQAAKAFPGLLGVNLAQRVCVKQSTAWHEQPADPRFHVVVYDCGVKWQILRLLVARGCRISLVPYGTSAEEIIALKPNGVLLSNGPGDPTACTDAILTIQKLIGSEIPLLGICLGFQLLALGLGARIQKMKFGHHGANHPVQDLLTGVVYITSQNHGFTVDESPDAPILADCEVTHRSLFDGTLQGFKHRTKPIMAVQGHPEASPGPREWETIFDQFIKAL